MRLTIPAIHQHKNHRPLVVLTAYTAPMTKLLDPHADILLVGDSLGMVVYGMESTLSVTLDMMLAHGKAVVKASQKACVVVDLPFGTYQASKEEAYRNAARLMAETGCSAVKLEGGAAFAETVYHLTSRGIPVIGHIGLTPQYVHQLGGYRYQGRDEEDEIALLHDAKALEEAGVFALVLEGMREDIGRHITEQVSMPTIGIGASPACDGQVLVIDDVLGMFTDFTPRFVKRYANIAETISDAAKRYAEEVRGRHFPTAAHCFMKKE